MDMNTLDINHQQSVDSLNSPRTQQGTNSLVSVDCTDSLTFTKTPAEGQITPERSINIYKENLHVKMHQNLRDKLPSSFSVKQTTTKGNTPIQQLEALGPIDQPRKNKLPSNFVIKKAKIPPNQLHKRSKSETQVNLETVFSQADLKKIIDSKNREVARQNSLIFQKQLFHLY